MKAATLAVFALCMIVHVVTAQAAGAQAKGALRAENIHGLSSLSAYLKGQSAETSASRLIDYYQFDYASAAGGKADAAARVSVVAQSDAGLKKTHLEAFLSPKTAPTSKAAISSSSSSKSGGHKVLAAVNGGYFNLSDGMSASYMTWDGKLLADPTVNKALTGNPRLKKYLPQIFDRSELRIFKDEKSGEYRYQICAHEVGHDQMKMGKNIFVGSIQGGPRLLPATKSVDEYAFKEAFLRREDDGSFSDSIGVRRTAARTAVGVTAQGRVMLVSVAGPKQDEFSSGLNLASLAELLQRLGCVEALNFDGGTSTTLVVRDLVTTGDGALKLAPDQKKIDDGYCMVVGREPETLVKSTLGLVCD
jgi:hypothetical protein